MECANRLGVRFSVLQSFPPLLREILYVPFLVYDRLPTAGPAHGLCGHACLYWKFSKYLAIFLSHFCRHRLLLFVCLRIDVDFRPYSGTPPFSPLHTHLFVRTGGKGMGGGGVTPILPLRTLVADLAVADTCCPQSNDDPWKAWLKYIETVLPIEVE